MAPVCPLDAGEEGSDTSASCGSFWASDAVSGAVETWDRCYVSFSSPAPTSFCTGDCPLSAGDCAPDCSSGGKCILMRVGGARVVHRLFDRLSGCIHSATLVCGLYIAEILRLNAFSELVLFIPGVCRQRETPTQYVSEVCERPESHVPLPGKELADEALALPKTSGQLLAADLLLFKQPHDGLRRVQNEALLR